MPLVDFNNLVNTSIEKKASGSAIKGPDTFIDATGIDSIFSSLENSSCLTFISHGNFSMHDFILMAIEKLSKPVNVFLTTFSMTELSARVLAKLKDSGDIALLNLLMDKESRKRYPDVDQILSNICDSIGYVNLHAKVLIIEGKTDQLTLIGSANWTKNPRIEVGIVDKNIESLKFHKQWIQKEISEHGTN